MVNMLEYEEWIQMYQRKMLYILLQNGINVPKEATKNIVSLQILLEKNGIMDEYPELEKVMKILRDGSSSYETRIAVMRQYIGPAFIQYEKALVEA